MKQWSNEAMLLIVGLGNPGEKYAHSRHNFGFAVADALQKKLAPSSENFSFEKKCNSLIYKTAGVLIAKPQAFMNNSGSAVQNIMNFYKLKSADLVVVHDDFDLPLGKLKLATGGGAAGHHGVESIIKFLSTPNFLRMRLGIFGQELKKIHDIKAEKIVLDTFSSKEKGEVKHVVKRAVEAIIFLQNHTVEETMNKFN